MESARGNWDRCSEHRRGNSESPARPSRARRRRSHFRPRLRSWCLAAWCPPRRRSPVRPRTGRRPHRLLPSLASVPRRTVGLGSSSRSWQCVASSFRRFHPGAARVAHSSSPHGLIYESPERRRVSLASPQQVECQRPQPARSATTCNKPGTSVKGRPLALLPRCREVLKLSGHARTCAAASETHRRRGPPQTRRIQRGSAHPWARSIARRSAHPLLAARGPSARERHDVQKR